MLVFSLSLAKAWVGADFGGFVETSTKGRCMWFDSGVLQVWVLLSFDKLVLVRDRRVLQIVEWRKVGW